MQERIVEIIVYLMNELRSEKKLGEVDVSGLASEGYTQSEISTAFSWVFDRLSAGQTVMEPAPRSVLSTRILHDAERMIITPEAQGYLIQCVQLGLLGNPEVETLVERIMAAGFGSVGLAEMKSLIAGLLFDTDNPLNGNGHFTLGTNDTIH
jgi:uncharacterized protein Smg (DUF494 family)